MKKLIIGVFLFILPFTGFAQFNISGKITDQSSGELLAGANVLLENTFKATASDFEGGFLLNHLKAGNYTLKVSFIGFKTFYKEIQLNEDIQLNISMEKDVFIADEIVVQATRANEKSAIAYTNLGKAELKKQNLGQDLPVLLNFTPSVVSTSDAGAGIGYTGIRIRGSDPTRINVTINGIPLNDAESQGVFWVNMPDFASSVENIQIQRGLGTSGNGAGAFGATLNIQTNSLNQDAYAEINNSFGSFNTWRHTVKVGTGLIDNQFSLEGRLSKITSDGFIDRAFSDLKSFYLSAAYHGKKNMLRMNIFSGSERTYQAWYGVPEAKLLKGNRSHNILTYDNEIDNYRQDHYQLFYSHDLNTRWDLNLAFHYTKGRGYFEQYRTDDFFADYDLQDLIIGADTIRQTDLIRRLWLDNDFYGNVFSLNYSGNKLNFVLGGGWNRYEGKHFGEIIWARFAGDSYIRQRYYENDATKTDFNIYSKAFYQISKNLNAFVDLQYRKVEYSFLGYDTNLRNVQQEAALNFFNPKLGFTYDLNVNSKIYASFGVGHREPNRNDYTESSAESRPKPEKLQNLELGYRTQSKNIAFSANFYWMNYQDELVLTGKLNDVGAYTRTNIDRSYRTGIELEGAIKFSDKWQWNLNATFSRNKVLEFREFLDDYDNGVQVTNIFKETDIAFSPDWIAASQWEYKVFKGFSLALLSKYVGRQFLDNTSNSNRRLDAFFTNDIRVLYSFKIKFIKEINLSLLLNNILQEEYEPNGYTFSYIAGGETLTENYYYPQAGRHFLLALGLRF